MPSVLIDAFADDSFTVEGLTAQILRAPYKPGRIGALGLFTEEGITTEHVVVEEEAGALALIPTSPRGGPAFQLSPNRRRSRPFMTTHLQKESTIYAHEVQGVRAFGATNDQAAAVQPIVDARLATLRAQHEVTLEWQRLGAIKGQILDADGTTVIYDLFDEFGLTQQTYTIDINTGAPGVRRQMVEIQRLSEDEMGGTPVSGYRGFAGDNFFDALIEAESVRSSLIYQESADLRRDLRKEGFAYGGILWENYRGRVNGVDFIDSDEAFVVPEAQGIFKTYFAPADFLETVNTVGLPLYAKLTYDQDLNRWVRVYTQSNPIALNLRPRSVIKVTLST